MVVTKDLTGVWINEELFWSRVTKTETCWLWDSPMPNGYGQFWIGKKSDGTRMRATAHRVAYQLLVGSDHDGLTLDHLCRNRACVNPAHLEPVTHVENVLRGSTPSARNKRAENCIHGHPLTGDNVYVYTTKAGKVMRICVECRRRRAREKYRRLRHDPEWWSARLAEARDRYAARKRDS